MPSFIQIRLASLSGGMKNTVRREVASTQMRDMSALKRKNSDATSF
jgi:hypothetical protein